MSKLKEHISVFLFIIFILGFPEKTGSEKICEPGQNSMNFSSENENCDNCQCSENGQVIYCVEESCTTDGSPNLSPWDIPDYKVVKKCAPGATVFSDCNICICSNNYLPTKCTSQVCDLETLKNININHPSYPSINFETN